ncbi:MAG: cell division protein FtsQ/DivIB [Candidatus Xenobia bacterium]
MIGKRRSRSKVSGVHRLTAGRKVQMVLFFLLAQAIFGFSDCFKIHHIRVQANERVAVADIVRQSGLHPQQHFLEVSLAAVQQRIMGMLWVQKAMVYWAFPGEVTISIQERKPAILLAEQPASKAEAVQWRSLPWYEADAEGLVLEQVENPRASRLPRLLVASPLQVGRRLPALPIQTVLQWADAYRKACPAPIAWYQVDGMGQLSFLTTLVGHPTPVRIGAPDKPHKVDVMQLLCERVERDARPVEYVDLRFEYPALRYPPPRDRKVSQVGKLSATKKR